MNAYGPSFRHITPDHTVFENKTVHKWFSVNIDLNLDDNTANEDRANIFALTDGTEYPNIGSQIPAVYLLPESMTLQVCMFMDGEESLCTEAGDAPIGEWFNLRVEQYCWLPWSDFCYVFIYVEETEIFFWWNDTPATFYNVEGVLGETYGRDDIVAASGKYAHFTLDQCEDVDDNCDVDFLTQTQPTHENAVNV